MPGDDEAAVRPHGHGRRLLVAKTMKIDDEHWLIYVGGSDLEKFPNGVRAPRHMRFMIDPISNEN